MDKIWKILIVLVVIVGAVGFWYVSNIREAPKETGTPIFLYYYNAEQDKDGQGNILCSRQGLVSVKRFSPEGATVEDAIKLLLRGEISEAERMQGITSEFPLAGLTLTDSTLKDGVLTLSFNDSQNKTVGGSCRVSVLWAQIEATAKQFPGVETVRFVPEELFQP